MNYIQQTKTASVSIDVEVDGLDRDQPVGGDVARADYGLELYLIPLITRHNYKRDHQYKPVVLCFKYQPPLRVFGLSTDFGPDCSTIFVLDTKEHVLGPSHKWTPCSSADAWAPHNGDSSHVWPSARPGRRS